MRTILGVVAALALGGCSTTTFLTDSEATSLERVAERASAAGWSIGEHTDTTLRISETWPWYSAASIGYAAFHADIVRTPPRVEFRLYLQANGLGTLWFPTRIDADDGFYGLALKPAIRRSAHQVLDWADVPNEIRPTYLRTMVGESDAHRDPTVVSSSIATPSEQAIRTASFTSGVTFPDTTRAMRAGRIFACCATSSAVTTSADMRRDRRRGENRATRAGPSP